MFDPRFPGIVKRGQILRASFNRHIDMGEASAFVANTAGSQPSERENPVVNNAVQASNATGSPAAALAEEMASLGEGILQRIRDRVPKNYDWSKGYDESLKDALQKHSDKFYANLTEEALNGSNNAHLQLYNEEQYPPENAHPEEQKLIFFQHLLFRYQRCEFQDNQNSVEEDTPPSKNLYVEGLADVGKAFVIITACNITIKIEKKNSSVQ